MWEVDFEYIREWLDSLDTLSVSFVLVAFEKLQEQGPTLGRPLVDTLSHTRVHNLKELRPVSPRGSEIRILFVFDQERRAIMLLGGDKAKGKNNDEKWNAWYRKAIPKAESIFFQHLRKSGDAHV